MKLLNRIWPWSKIHQLQSQLGEERKYSNTLTEALLEIDPQYFEKRKYRLYCSSPRMSFKIEGIQ